MMKHLLVFVALATVHVNSFPHVRKLSSEALQQRYEAIQQRQSPPQAPSKTAQATAAGEAIPFVGPPPTSVATDGGGKKILEPDSKSHEDATSAKEKQLMIRREQRSLVKSALVTFMVFGAAIADVLSFKIFGFYASMMTGNTLRLCNALTENRLPDALFYVCAIVSYTIGSVIYHWVNQAETALMTAAKEQKKMHYRSKYKAFSVFAFSIFVGGDMLFRFLRLPGKWLGPFLSMGFGFVNSLCSVETAVINFATTGHIHKLGLGIVDSLQGTHRDTTDSIEAKKVKDLKNSIKTIGVFSSTIFVAATLWQKSPRWLISFLKSPDSPPPLGLFFGLFYGSVFAWCGAEFFRIRTTSPLLPGNAFGRNSAN